MSHDMLSRLIGFVGKMSNLVCTRRELINWYNQKEQLPLRENHKTFDGNDSICPLFKYHTLIYIPMFI